MKIYSIGFSVKDKWAKRWIDDDYLRRAKDESFEESPPQHQEQWQHHEIKKKKHKDNFFCFFKEGRELNA